jgi:phosphoglycerate dehydrogenase-like enzyme
VFYNIGRGSTVSQSALDSALRTGRLSAAYLDVTDPEPLPPDHLLWTSPNCFITPHIGGGHGDETITLVRHFLENLRHYEADQPLKDRIV